MMDTTNRGGVLTAPSLAPDVRAQMAEALYSNLYANALPRPEFEKQFSGKSDFEIADAAYNAFYKGKLDRTDFNKQIGFSTAPGSTNAALMQGVSLGLSDELAAVGAGALGAVRGKGFIDNYRAAMNAQRENAEIFRQNNPYIGRGTEVLGSALTGIAGTAAAGMAPTMGRAALQGAGIGGVAGAASADGGLQDRALGGAVGAGIGAALPAAINLVAPPVASAWSSARTLLGGGDAAAQAERKLLQTMERAGTSTQGVRQAIADAAPDKPIAMVDVMGRPGANLGTAVANRPGAATEMADRFVELRRAGTPDRIQDDIARMIAPGHGDNYATVVQSLSEARRANAAPLYEEAFSRPAGMTDRLREFIRDPISRSGLARGLELQRLENLARPPNARQAVTDAAIEFAEDGTPRIVSVPNMRTLDAIKRGLDDILEGYRDKTTGRLVLDQRGRAIDAVRRSFVAELDQGNPAYRAAREAWAGPSQAWDEMAMGRRIVTADRDSVARILENIPPERRDFYRMGVARALTDRTSDPASAGSFVRRMVEDRNLSNKLSRLFDNPDEYQSFVNAMQAELTMRATNRAVSPRANSHTARILAEQDDMSAAGTGLAQDLLATGARGGRPTWGVLSRLYERGKAGSPEMAEQIGQRLFSTDRDMIVNALSGMDRRLAEDRATRELRERIARALMGGGGAGTSQQSAP